MDTNGTVLQGRFIIKDKDALCKALNITNLALLKSGLQFVIPKSEVFKLFRNSFQVIRNSTENDLANTEKEIPSKNKELSKIRSKSWNDSSFKERSFSDKRKYEAANFSDRSGIKYTSNEIGFDQPIVKIKRCDEANAPTVNKESNVSTVKYSSKTVKHLFTSSKNISNYSVRTTSLHKRHYQPFKKCTSWESSKDFSDKSQKRPNNSVNFQRTITHLRVKKISYQSLSNGSSPQIKVKKCNKFHHCSSPSKKTLMWEYKADKDITFRNYIPIDSNLSKDEQEEAVKLVEESKRAVVKSKDKTISKALKVNRMRKSLRSEVNSTAVKKRNKVRLINNNRQFKSSKKTVKQRQRTPHTNNLFGTSSKSPDSIYERNLIKQSSLIGKRRSEDSHLLKRQGRRHQGVKK